jgi:flagellar biosynthesis/type III secretory pathway protein FliH
MAMRTHIVKFDRPLVGATLAFPLAPGSASDISEVQATPHDSCELGKTNDAVPDTSFHPQADLKALLEQIQQNIQVLKQNQNDTLRQFQELAIRLAHRMAEAVVLHDVSHHDTRIRALLDSCLQRFEPEHPVTVRLNKTDLDRLLISFPDSPSLVSDIHLQQDNSIKPGDCQVESKGHSIVATIDRQLDEIQTQMMEALEDARTEPDSIDESDPQG